MTHRKYKITHKHGLKKRNITYLCDGFLEKKNTDIKIKRLHCATSYIYALILLNKPKGISSNVTNRGKGIFSYINNHKASKKKILLKYKIFFSKRVYLYYTIFLLQVRLVCKENNVHIFIYACVVWMYVCMSGRYAPYSIFFSFFYWSFF